MTGTILMTFSPLSVKTRRQTPWVDGWCGPVHAGEQRRSVDGLSPGRRRAVSGRGASCDHGQHEAVLPLPERGGDLDRR